MPGKINSSGLALNEPIIIVGAGVGGLTTALQLHANGFTNVHIFEASSTLSTLGVGINVQPSAVLILRNLGLLPALEATGVKTGELNFYNRYGHSILSEARGLNAGYDIPQFSIHRGEFQILLLDAVKERLGDSKIHLNHALSSFDQQLDDVGNNIDGHITAHFIRRRDAATHADIPSMTASVLIACDGINSTARRILYPDEGPANFSGRMLWRGCLEREPYLTGSSMVWAGHANQKFIAYPISGASQRKGTSLVNWIAELRVRSEDDPDTTPPEKPDWTQTVPKERFAEEFKSWTFGFLDTYKLIQDTERVYEFPMCDRDPISRWSFGRLTLLGDAAHPMYPSKSDIIDLCIMITDQRRFLVGSNGASQAIIDSLNLVQSLLLHRDDVDGALKAYQDIRLPATGRIVLANRANGPDAVMQVAYERAPNGFDDINDVIPQQELDSIGQAYKAVAGFEKENVNRSAKETNGAAEKLGLTSPKNWVVNK